MSIGNCGGRQPMPAENYRAAPGPGMAKTIVNLNTIWITLAGLAFFKGAPT